MPEADISAHRAEYDAILSSGIFAPQSNSGRFLHYVAAQYFSGERAVTEYSIAVNGLGRREDFDPKQDTIVRVEAHRARKRLSEYYQHEGSDHPLRMVIPLGSYLPVFTPRDATVAGQAPPFPAGTPDQGAGRRAGWRLAAAGATVLVLLAAGLVLLDGRVGAFLLHPQGSKINAAQTLAASPAKAELNGDIRIAAGAAETHVDDMGRVWQQDRYFTGGFAISASKHRILRTMNPTLYRKGRGGEFSYAIPLQPGLYELLLHFAEVQYSPDVASDGTGERVFDVRLNGKTLLFHFDIVLNANGADTADPMAFRDVSPASDGFLHLQFEHNALLNGIEILPERQGKVRPVRIVCAPLMHYDVKGNLWETDRYFLGGKLEQFWFPVTGTADPGLYAADRWGSFTYAIPAAPGAYSLSLYFSEPYYGSSTAGQLKSYEDGVGMRVFDVYCNKAALLKGFDIFKEAHGENRAVVKSFRNLKPNAEGKLLLDFVPVRDTPNVQAIEVLDEKP